MKRVSAIVGVVVAVAIGAAVLVATGTAAQWSQACHRLPDLYAASKAQLQACGLTEAPLSGTSSLPGGGKSYNYRLPDGQRSSVIQVPAGFNPRKASPAEAKAYGIPPAPSRHSSGYAAWRTLTNGNYAPVHARPYLVVGDRPLTQPQSSSSTTLNPNAGWAGYLQAPATGTPDWKYAEVQYNEPTLGVTHCSNPSVSFWVGIGDPPVPADGLGQTGTASGGNSPNGPIGLHRVFVENLPANPVYETATAPAGKPVIDNVQYLGNKNWSYTDSIDGTTYDYGGTGPYDGNAAEAITEQQLTGSLLNFESITMHATVGLSNADMNPSQEDTLLSGDARVGAISKGTFTVTHTACS